MSRCCMGFTLEPKSAIYGLWVKTRQTPSVLVIKALLEHTHACSLMDCLQKLWHCKGREQWDAKGTYGKENPKYFLFSSLEKTRWMCWPLCSITRSRSFSFSAECLGILNFSTLAALKRHGLPELWHLVLKSGIYAHYFLLIVFPWVQQVQL